jgi:hypothetical protein
MIVSEYTSLENRKASKIWRQYASTICSCNTYFEQKKERQLKKEKEFGETWKEFLGSLLASVVKTSDAATIPNNAGCVPSTGITRTRIPAMEPNFSGAPSCSFASFAFRVVTS